MPLDELLYKKLLKEWLAHTQCSTNVCFYFAQQFVNLQGWRLVEMSTGNLINPAKDKMSNSKYNLTCQYATIISISLGISVLQIHIALVQKCTKNKFAMVKVTQTSNYILQVHSSLYY